MKAFDDIIADYYSQHDKYSIRTSWHQQHIIEDVLDLQGFISSISENKEEKKLTEPITSYPLGYFQIEQPSRINYTYLIYLFTILERRLRALIKLSIELKSDITKGLTDYKGSFIDRARLFFKENIDLDLSESSIWPEIMTFQKVRDCILHCGGNVNESRNKDFLTALADKKRIELNGNGYIRIDSKFCGEMEGAILEFLSKGLENLYAELVKLEVRKKNTQ